MHSSRDTALDQNIQKFLEKSLYFIGFSIGGVCQATEKYLYIVDREQVPTAVFLEPDTDFDKISSQKLDCSSGDTPIGTAPSHYYIKVFSMVQ